MRDEKNHDGVLEKAELDGVAYNDIATDSNGSEVYQFDAAAESKLRLKIDLFIVPTVSLIYLFCFIDRANIGNARLAGLEKDLNLKGYDYNQVLSVFYISYILFEIPSTMACKAMGPGWFLPLTTLLFGVSSLGTAFCNSIHSICGVRFVLGIFEAGMMPGIAYYLSRWYRKSELAFRLSLYIVMAPLAGAFGGLLASAILKLDHFGGLHKWRMIFAIEGIITILLGLIAFLTLTDRPETARWLNEKEKALAIARVKSERVGQTELLDKMDMKKIMRGILNPNTLVTSFIFLLNNVTVQGLAFFAPTIVATIYPAPQHSTVFQQLKTVPPYIIGAFFTVAIPFMSWRMNKRVIWFIASAPLTMIGYIMFLASKNPNTRYGATFLIAASAFSLGALCNAHVSANVVSDTSRGSAIGTNVMFGNIGGLIATWSFLPFDKPDYKIGNGLNLATSSTIFVVSILLLLWMTANNRKRESVDTEGTLSGLSQKEIDDLDYRHPGFRWHP
ncbi:putative MFS transporter [Microthyrium microscopicum]|uniref:Putative MFS transporter n=1 Tax=Microthyrium microscopicum TaxID=703497 RepID=A0A6A6UIV0_9PEZI|nr:putative MFS transporter [Microthyrium microscopicum]